MSGMPSGCCGVETSARPLPVTTESHDSGIKFSENRVGFDGSRVFERRTWENRHKFKRQYEDKMAALKRSHAERIAKGRKKAAGTRDMRCFVCVIVVYCVGVIDIYPPFSLQQQMRRRVR